MINLYDHYASIYGQVNPGEKKWIKETLKCTPYYFPEPISFRDTVHGYYEQLNLPSPQTFVQFTPAFDYELTRSKAVLIVVEEKSSKISILAVEDTDNFPVLRLEGTIHKNPITQMWEIHPYGTAGQAPPEAVEAYEKVFNIVLMHINITHPRQTQRSLPRQQRRAAERSLGFPLKATTEITIRPGSFPQSSAATGGGGEKCLHEVKGHVRIYKRGTPEERAVWINSYDRGNPALGVKKTKYKVETD
jgi:hypothetical protein